MLSACSSSAPPPTAKPSHRGDFADAPPTNRLRRKRLRSRPRQASRGPFGIWHWVTRSRRVWCARRGDRILPRAARRALARRRLCRGTAERRHQRVHRGPGVEEQVPQIADFKPHPDHVPGRCNDLANGVSVDDYRGDVQDILDAATDSGARVIVLAQNECFVRPPGRATRRPKRAPNSMSVLIEEAQDRGAQFVDMRPLLQAAGRREPLGGDGIHPTPEAYRAWSDETRNQVPAPCRE